MLALEENMIVIGVDVGASGGFAVIEDGELIETFSMPVTAVAYKGKTRNEINGKAICEFFETHRPNIIAIESVNARPGQGVTSMYRFGYASGVVYGAASARWRECEIQMIRPQ